MGGKDAFTGQCFPMALVKVFLSCLDRFEQDLVLLELILSKRQTSRQGPPDRDLQTDLPPDRDLHPCDSLLCTFCGHQAILTCEVDL